jgi:hypothetical protein
MIAMTSFRGFRSSKYRPRIVDLYDSQASGGTCSREGRLPNGRRGVAGSFSWNKVSDVTPTAVVSGCAFSWICHRHTCMLPVATEISERAGVEGCCFTTESSGIEEAVNDDLDAVDGARSLAGLAGALPLPLEPGLSSRMN